MFSLAKNASQLSDFPKQKLGCVIIYKNKVISVGYNTTKENPIQKKYNISRGFDVHSAKNSLHAEMMALNKIKDMDINYEKATICVYREFKNGKLALAKPCFACMNAIKDFGIKDIYYTDYEGTIHKRIGGVDNEL